MVRAVTRERWEFHHNGVGVMKVLTQALEALEALEDTIQATAVLVDTIRDPAVLEATILDTEALEATILDPEALAATIPGMVAARAVTTQAVAAMARGAVAATTPERQQPHGDHRRLRRGAITPAVDRPPTDPGAVGVTQQQADRHSPPPRQRPGQDSAETTRAMAAAEAAAVDLTPAVGVAGPHSPTSSCAW